MALQQKTKKLLGGLTAAALVAAAAAVWFASRSTAVPLTQIESRDISEVYVVTGRVRSRTTSGIGSDLAGRVAEVHVREGSKPRRTDPLVDLQPIDAELAVRQAEANYEIAKRELERVRRGPTRAQREQAVADVAAARADFDQASKDLARARAMTRGGVGTPVELERAESAKSRAEARLNLAKARLDELDELPRSSDIRVAQARLDAAQANLDQSQATLGKTTISAPFDGLVLAVDASIGEMVQPGQRLITLVRVDELELYAEVDEAYFGRLKQGLTATVVFPSLPDEQFAATVTQVGPDVDPDRGVIAVHLDPDSLPDNVTPGLSADVAIELTRLENARAIPNAALGRDDGTYAMVIRDGKAHRISVEVLAEGEAWIAVSGLDDVDEVIANLALVEENQKVRPEAN